MRGWGLGLLFLCVVSKAQAFVRVCAFCRLTRDTFAMHVSLFGLLRIAGCGPEGIDTKRLIRLFVLTDMTHMPPILNTVLIP